MKKAVFGLLIVLVIAVIPAARADFVCPVFNDNSKVGENNPNAVLIGEGDYSIIGPDVNVPDQATNGDGSGIPGSEHSNPGDTDYSAIWNS